MKKQLKTYLFEKWWISLLTFIISSTIMISLISSTNNNAVIISDYFYLLTAVLLLIAGIWQLFKGKWYLGLLQLGTLFIGFVILIYVATFMSMFGPDTDTFADNIELPKNVNLEEPIVLKMGGNLDGIRPEVNLSNDITETEFQIYSSFQPGLYEYDVWIKTSESGKIHLKAFEITQEIELSKSRLKERSTIKVNDTNGVFQKFGTSDHFTIYEGDWGKPYGARFEIWFTSDITNESKKLKEKNYKIEGWMR